MRTIVAMVVVPAAVDVTAAAVEPLRVRLTARRFCDLVRKCDWHSCSCSTCSCIEISIGFDISEAEVQLKTTRVSRVCTLKAGLLPFQASQVGPLRVTYRPVRFLFSVRLSTASAWCSAPQRPITATLLDVLVLSLWPFFIACSLLVLAQLAQQQVSLH